MGVRIPTILGKAIDDVTLTLNQEVSLAVSAIAISCLYRRALVTSS